MEDHSICQNRRREAEKVPGKTKKIQVRRYNAASAGTQGMETAWFAPKRKNRIEKEQKVR